MNRDDEATRVLDAVFDIVKPHDDSDQEKKMRSTSKCQRRTIVDGFRFCGDRHNDSADRRTDHRKIRVNSFKTMGLAMSSSPYVRRAHHAGSWYSSSPDELDGQLSSYLSDVVDSELYDASVSELRGLIGPHAGYSYSGPTAAYAYKVLTRALKKQTYKTIVVLHPAHHVYLDACAVSGASRIDTPLGNMVVNDTLRQRMLQLNNTNKNIQFSTMDQPTDEEEHSGEMHYPYIVKSCLDAGGSSLLSSMQILPIMVGATNENQEQAYGQALGPILLDDPAILTIVSTDFCHWGSRFRYQPTGSKEIYQHIRELDHEGMNHIEMQQPGGFAKYLKRTRNTICGRHPLGVWLQALQHADNITVKFVRYAQSSQVTSMRDSSVSYASAIATRSR